MLLPGAARPCAVAIVIVCVVVVAVQAVWLRHGMETSGIDPAVDAKLTPILGPHPLLLDVLVWPGEPVAVTAMTGALVLACVGRRRYNQAALVAISLPLAAAFTELVLKPFIGGTSWGNPFPSGHVTGVAALATCVTVLLVSAPAKVPRPLRFAGAVAAFLVTAAVALGVIGASMHHFADTVGGTAVGAGTVLLIALMLDVLSARRPRPGQPVELDRPADRIGSFDRSAVDGD